MKTNKLFYLFISLSTTLFLSCNKEEDFLPINESSKIVENIQNIKYGVDPQQSFDLYLPANRSATTKTLLLIHGGGWISGDKIEMNSYVSMLKEKLPDYAIANMNYRLASGDNYAFPMQIEDINSVITILKATDEYVISDNFALIGVSAGGQLALLYSYSNNSNNDVKMVCSIIGPTNFTDINYANNKEMVDLFTSITGVNYQENKPFYDMLSPLNWASETSPPTILFYGNQDPIVPTTQGIGLRNRLNELSVYNKFNLYNGGHGDWSTSDLTDVNKKLVNFIKQKFN